MRQVLIGAALLAMAAAACDRSAPPAPAAPAEVAAPVAPPPPAVPSAATTRPAAAAVARDGQNFTINASGPLRIVGSETQYDILLPADVLFDFDEADLRPEAGPLLAQLREHFRTHRADQVHVSGHTDSVGEDQYNFRLSNRRAASVCGWLRRETALQTTNCIGRGEQEPTAPNANPDGSDNPLNRQLNRRVQLRVVAYPDVQSQMNDARAAGQAARDAIEASRAARN